MKKRALFFILALTVTLMALADPSFARRSSKKGPYDHPIKPVDVTALGQVMTLGDHQPMMIHSTVMGPLQATLGPRGR